VCVALLLAGASIGSSTGARGDVAPPGLGRPCAPGQIVSGETALRLIHFTFDDGPDPRTTPSMLNALDTAGVKATFFFTASRFRGSGSAAQRARQLALEVRRRGHSIGSHSVDHKRMRSMGTDELDAQLNESDRLFNEIFGQRTYLFRPPWGSHSPLLDQKVAAREGTLVMWNLGMADWVERPPQELADSFMRRLDRAEREHGQRGGIILMHDIHPWSVAAFPLIVGALRTRSCQLLARNEEPYQITDDLEPWFSGHRTSDSRARATTACGR
jgi:peptidoglycan/xylan/chitin deacetylase (PgdA/CDA1 family)